MVITYPINTTTPILFSPSCNEIFHHKSDEQYTRWMKHTKYQSITLYTVTREQCDIIPSDCVLIQQNHNKVFKYFYQHNIQSSIQTNIRTLNEYIHHNPPHIRQLISKDELNHSSDSFLQLINNKSMIFISTDGAREDTKSGGGWLIATETGQ